MMRVGIVGCGQLARMLALAGWPMGLSFSFLAEATEEDVCVRGLGKVVRLAADLDGQALYEAMERPAVITVEKEHVDVALLRRLQGFCPVYPDPDIVEICQHRGREKSFLNQAAIATAPWQPADSLADVKQAVQALGLPVFIKSCELGYDGQNQWRLKDASGHDDFMARQGDIPPCVVEGQVHFEREVSIIVARGVDGETVVYPLTENDHQQGTLLTSISPVDDLPEAMRSQAEDIVSKLLSRWNYVGVLAIECFVSDKGLLVNELAPRVHNSGHWTQQGAATDQFENHMRAITGRALGSTESTGYTGMINLLGRFAPADVAVRANSHLHLYNKAAKPRRKLGHINLHRDDKAALEQQMREMVESIYSSESE